jgi:fatty-acyl-CoA synthase
MTTVAAMLAARADDDRPGVVDATGSWTWREAVAEGAARGALARTLIGTGLPHVGVLLPNGPEYLFWLNGTALAGAAIVGINPTRRGDALAADIRATDCGLIVTDPEGAALLEGLDLGAGRNATRPCWPSIGEARLHSTSSSTSTRCRRRRSTC